MTNKQNCYNSKKITSIVMATILCLFLWRGDAYSCGIRGRAVRTDGSRVDGTARISTNWNSLEAYPRDGRYALELGQAACGETIEVFVNGYSIGRYTLPRDGYTTVDTILKGTSDMPMR